MTLSHQDVRNILSILDQAEHLESIDLTVGDFHLQARKPGASRMDIKEQARPTRPPESGTSSPHASAAAPATSDPVIAPGDPAMPPGFLPVCAPMLGTFYARPSPELPPFVDVGTRVQADDTVGLVEVMKMFNSIKAGVSGTVRRIVAESGKPVRQGQTLLWVEPIIPA